MFEFAMRVEQYMNWQLFLHHLMPYRLRRLVSAYISFQSTPVNWVVANSTICHSHNWFLSVEKWERFDCEWIYASVSRWQTVAQTIYMHRLASDCTENALYESLTVLFDGAGDVDCTDTTSGLIFVTCPLADDLLLSDFVASSSNGSISNSAFF